MSQHVRVRAHANIALAKYWGKANGPDNAPATPSLSLALDVLATETTIDVCQSDQFQLEGVSSELTTAFETRISAALASWRSLTGYNSRVRITTHNSFPAKAGLASSASGMAALGMALNELHGQPLDQPQLVRWVRRLSGSAARSVSGGLSILPTGEDPAPQLLVPPNDVPWGMVVAVVEDHQKRVGSTEGMELCRRTSPLYLRWVEQAKCDFEEMLAALERDDFTRLGELAEQNCIAMHACAVTSNPPLMYWSEKTLRLIQCVREWRRNGLKAYFTTDAGPNVCVLAQRERLDELDARVKEVEGVKQVLIGKPAGCAEVLECR